MAAPQPTLDHYQGGSITHPMLITAFLHVQPEGHWEPCDEVGSLSPAESLVGFEPGTFRFWQQRLNLLGQLNMIYNAKENLKSTNKSKLQMSSYAISVNSQCKHRLK